MCESMVDIQSATVENMEEKKQKKRRKKKKAQDENIMACPFLQDSHNYYV